MSKIIDAIRSWRGPGGSAEAELPGVLTRRKMLEQLAKVHPERFPLGVAADGVLVWDTERDSHLLAAGTLASGKSTTELGIACHALSHADTWSLYACDPRGIEYGYLAGYTSAERITDPEAILSALREVVAEIERRFEQMEAAGVSHIRYLDPPPKRILVMVDELAEVLAAQEAAANRASLERIAALGRDAGVHLVLATQGQDAVGSAILRNVTGRLACGRMSRTASLATIGSEAAAYLPSRAPGRAIYGSGVEASAYTEREVQLAYTDTGDLPEPE